MAKKPGIPARDGGLAFSIRNPNDGTPRGAFSVSDILYSYTEKCTYKIQMADRIDPNRENANLPPVIQQKLFDHGSSSILFQRTVLTSKTLFKKDMLGENFPYDTALVQSLAAREDLSDMDKLASTFKAKERVIAEVSAHQSTDSSLTLPSVGNVRSSRRERQRFVRDDFEPRMNANPILVY